MLLNRNGVIGFKEAGVDRDLLKMVVPAAGEACSYCLRGGAESHLSPR